MAMCCEALLPLFFLKDDIMADTCLVNFGMGASMRVQYLRQIIAMPLLEAAESAWLSEPLPFIPVPSRVAWLFLS